MTKLVLITRTAKFINLIFEFSDYGMTYWRKNGNGMFFLKKVGEKFGG